MVVIMKKTNELENFMRLNRVNEVDKIEFDKASTIVLNDVLSRISTSPVNLDGLSLDRGLAFIISSLLDRIEELEQGK